MSGGAGLGLLLAVAWAGIAPAARAQAPRTTVVTSLTLFAGTKDGLWRSTSWGSNWERVQLRGIEALGAARFILPMGPWVYAGGDGGLFYSEDFGESWVRLYSASRVLCALSSRYPQADPTLFVGTPQGLLKSPDAGRSVRETPLKDTPVYRVEWPGPALVVATGRGVLISEDGGERFRAAETGLPEDEVRALALSSLYAMDPVLFAGVGARGVFRSKDGGRTWSASGLAGRAVTDLAWLGPFLYAVTDAGLFRSEDAGGAWSPLGEGLAGRKPSRILFPLFPDSGAEAFLATDRGAYWTGDGGLHWQASGLVGEDVLSLATFPPAERAPRKKPKK